MIPYFDLGKVLAPHRAGFEKTFSDVFSSGWLILGKRLEQFESEFSAYCGSAHCIGTGNGLDALILIFRAYLQLGRLQPGDEVIVPANTYIASILSISEAGLTPVLAEPDPETFNLSLDSAQKAIGPKTRAILAVHLYGQLADPALRKLADDHNLLLIEDSAQAQGAEVVSDGKVFKAGNFGHASGFSFYPTKNLGCLGDGGAVTTNDDDLAETLKMLRNYGSKVKYQNEIVGVNSRLDELQAAFLSLRLPQLDTENDKRRHIAKQYLDGIRNPKIKLPFYDGSAGHVFHVFAVRTADRDDLQRYLSGNGIGTMIHYPTPPHQQPAFGHWNKLSLPITQAIHREILSLPMSPAHTPDEIATVVNLLNRY